MYPSGYEKYESSNGRRFFSPMSGTTVPCSLTIVVGSGATLGFTNAHFSQNTVMNKMMAPKQIRKNGRTLRFRKRFSACSIRRSRLHGVTAHFSGDPESGDKNQGVRTIHKNIGFQRNVTEVGEEIDSDVDQIPGSENVKVNSRSFRSGERPNDAKLTSAEMPEIHDACHVKEAEHQ